MFYVDEALKLPYKFSVFFVMHGTFYKLTFPSHLFESSCLSKSDF